MGILSNFIAGAAGAGGEILQRERESGVRKDEAKFADELATKREQTLAALRNQYQIDAEGRQVTARREEETYQSSPERIAQLTAADRAKNEGLIGNRIALAPKAAEATAVEFEAGAGTRKAAQDEKLSFALTEFRQKTAAELEAEIKKLNDPKYLAGKAKEAAAGRDPNSAALARVQLQSAQIALKEKQAEARIPPAVKGSIAAIQKQADAISAAVTKAELEGTAAPEAIKKYQERLSELNGQISKLYEPYMDKTAKPADAAPAAMQDVRVGGKVIGKASTPEEAAALVAEFRKTGKAAPAAGNKEPAAPAGPPVDRLRDQPIGILTPLATIREAAAAGNKQAKAYLERRAQGQADTEAAPRTAAEMLNQ